MPPAKKPDESTTPVFGSEQLQEAYELGYQDGKAQAEREYEAKNRPPLFEACKRLAVKDWQDTHFEGLHRAIDAAQEEYGETLSRADRDLVVGVARRRRAAVEAAPNRPMPTVSHATGKPPEEQRAETEYETVR